jgi:hypothetical protein
LRESIINYDQLSTSDNKQDKGAVLSLMEATMMAIRRHMPHIKRLIIQSGSASYYQNVCIILMLPILGHRHRIQVQRYEHTDTQDGKSPLDGHFGQTQRKVRRFVKQGNNCVTPTQYVVALRADDNLPNCVAELVQYDRSSLTQLLKSIEPLDTALSTLVKQPNDVFYEYPESPVHRGAFDISKSPNFFISVFSYSAVGDGIRILISLSKGTCTKVSKDDDENTQDDGDNGDEGSEDDAIGRPSPGEAASTRTEDDQDRVDQNDEDLVETSATALQSPVGLITGVSIIKTAQLKRRVRKWKFGERERCAR